MTATAIDYFPMKTTTDSTAKARAERRAAADRKRKEKEEEEAAVLARLAEEKQKREAEKQKKQEEKDRAAKAAAASAEKEAAARAEAARRTNEAKEAAAAALAAQLAGQRAGEATDATTPHATGGKAGGTAGVGLGEEPPLARNLDGKFRDTQEMEEDQGGKEEAEDGDEGDGTYTGEKGEEGDDEGEGENEGEEEQRDVMQSPVKKRTRREKKKKARAEKKAEKKAAKRKEAEAPTRKHGRSTETEAPKTPTPNTANAGSTPAPKGVLRTTKKRLLDEYTFEYTRMLIQASVTLSEENRHAEYVQKLRGLLQEIQTVDPKFIYEPLEASELELRCEKPADIPVNMTQVCGIFDLDDKQKFQDVEDWHAKNRAEQAGEDVSAMEFTKNPEVFFCFYFSCDKPPAQIMRRVKQEWERQGGKRLEMKAIQSRDTESALVLYKIHNRGDKDELIDELEFMAEQGKEMECMENDDFEVEWGMSEVPMMHLNLATPKIPGQDPQQFKGLTSRQQQNRKAYHVVVKAEEVLAIQAFIEAAKKHGLLKKMWGDNCIVANVVVTKDRHAPQGRRAQAAHAAKHGTSRHSRKATTARELAKLGKVAKSHISYQSTMNQDGIEGLIDIDEKVPIYSPVDGAKEIGVMTLREVMYKHITRADGFSLFGEIHQPQPLAPVTVVVQRLPEVTRTMEMLNDNVGAYLHFALRQAGIEDKDFIGRLLKASVAPDLLLEIPQCSWDAKTGTLTTPRTVENERKRQMEADNWFPTENRRRVEDRNLAASQVYDLDGDHSVKTLNSRPGRYEGTPGAPTINLTNRRKKGPVTTVNLTEEELEEMSVMTGMSREGGDGEVGLDELCAKIDRATLIATLQKLQTTAKGSQPEPGNEAKSGGATHSADGGSSSEEDGSSESESSEVSDGSSVASVTSRASVGTATRTPGSDAGSDGRARSPAGAG